MKPHLIRTVLLLVLAALLLGPILAAPVMREPTGTITAADYFGND
jgi:hypothetical protein